MTDLKIRPSLSRHYVEACRDFGVVDPAEIVKKLLAKFAFLTEEKAKEYAS